MTRPCRIALGLLTRLPIPWRGDPPTRRERGLSVLCYPLAGGVIGLLLALVALGMVRAGIDAGIGAGLLLLLWVWLTGGLHLDGLADTADAWIGGMGDRQRMLDIMKDPDCGPAGVVAIVLTLILKFAALKTLLELQNPWLLPVAPVLGRVGIVALFLVLPYVRPNGMGAEAAAALPRRGGVALLVGCALAVAALWRTTGLLLLAAWMAGWQVVRRGLQRRLGGVTGDTVGALCEVTETIVVLTAALAGV